MEEVINAFDKVEFIIEKLIESPPYDEYKNIHGDFSLVASKYEIVK